MFTNLCRLLHGMVDARGFGQPFTTLRRSISSTVARCTCSAETYRARDQLTIHADRGTPGSSCTSAPVPHGRQLRGAVVVDEFGRFADLSFVDSLNQLRDAAGAIRSSRRAILVEGYLDACSSGPARPRSCAGRAGPGEHGERGARP
jgi:hypothetical protein